LRGEVKFGTPPTRWGKKRGPNKANLHAPNHWSKGRGATMPMGNREEGK